MVFGNMRRRCRLRSLHMLTTDFDLLDYGIVHGHVLNLGWTINGRVILTDFTLKSSSLVEHRVLLGELVLAKAYVRLRFALV